MPDRVGDPENDAAAAKVMQDTVWIADWTFDAGGTCTNAGWTLVDNRILNDGSIYWSIGDQYDGAGSIASRAAVLGTHELCWPTVDGYGNDWDQSIRLKYQGVSTLSFDYLLDSEPVWDVLRVEADSLGKSFERVDYAIYPGGTPDRFRQEIFRDSGSNHAGWVSSLTLPDYGPGLHTVYIRFKSNYQFSAEDVAGWSSLGAALVVDNVTVVGGLTYTENFEAGFPLNPNMAVLNSAPIQPFGEWARLYSHVTDNDKCSENTTCAWLWSDHTTPTGTYWPNMAFGPGGLVVRNWLDDIIQSPWVSLATTPNLGRTLVSFRIFGGNTFDYGRIMINLSARGKLTVDNTDTPEPGDVVVKPGPWGNPWWYSPGFYNWTTWIQDMTPWLSPYFDEPSDIQVRFRVSDWQYISGFGPPPVMNPGPGPYVDRVRIGRMLLTGPVVRLDPDSRLLAQDAFATQQNGMPGEHFEPSDDRFGTCAFSSSDDLGLGWTWNLITGDSIVVQVLPRQGIPITGVSLYAWIVAGPHTGKAPAPYVVNPDHGFVVQADTVRAGDVSFLANWCVDFDDTYFRGGDVLHYIWTATDANGGFTSYPLGLTAAPISRADAEARTHGLLEVSFLPSITWDPNFLARVQADQHGDLEPSTAERQNSLQSNCVLYCQQVNGERRTGDANRTSFMYTLDNLGYRGYYDVYDDQGVNSSLAGRASQAQALGYSLIIQDCGEYGWISQGRNFLFDKVNQASWYSNYLVLGSVKDSGHAGLWLVGENVPGDLGGSSLLDWMGVQPIAANINVANPDVVGVSSFEFEQGCVSNFAGDSFSLAGGCPTLHDYDPIGALGAAVVTHRYATSGTPGAVVMNKDGQLSYDAVMMGFNWNEIVSHQGSSPSPPSPTALLAAGILRCVLPIGCVRNYTPITDREPIIAAVPGKPALHPNVPNPFNPTTSLPFDVAQSGHVQLVVFDVSGRRVRTLVDSEYPAGRHQHRWDGLDDAGDRVASGVYIVRMKTGDFVASRRIVVLR